MDQKLIQQLLESDAGRALISFLAKEAESLNTLSGIEGTSKEEIALEVLARKRAYEKLLVMLEPFLNNQNSIGVGVSNKDFVV